MGALIWMALSAAAAAGPDPALALRARADFEKVETATRPRLEDTIACVQSQAAVLPVTRVEERHRIHYQKGFCTLLGAALTRDQSEFQQAAREFQKTIGEWPPKSGEPVCPAVRILNILSRLQGAQFADSLEQELAAELAGAECSRAALMAAPVCHVTVDAGRLWLAWRAMSRDDLSAASRILDPYPRSPWNAWLGGRRAMRERRPRGAVSLFEEAIQVWIVSAAGLAALLGPRPDIPRAYYELGLARFLTQDYRAAISDFDTSLKQNPANPHAIFLRGRAKQSLGMAQAAMADVELASKIAYANSEAGSATGRFYRGVLLFQRKQYDQAEAEFAGALSSEDGDVPREDIAAWWRMASVAGGACESSAEYLEDSTRRASDLFPRDEAEAVLAACRVQKISTLEQIQQFEQALGERVRGPLYQFVRTALAEAWVRQGVTAEDRKDLYFAASAYRKALDWNPRSAKARLRLGAVYFEQKKYPLAEGEFRGLTEDDPDAQYWLAQSILAQRPSSIRKTEACGLLRRSLGVSDAAKKSRASAALSAAQCPD